MIRFMVAGDWQEEVGLAIKENEGTLGVQENIIYLDCDVLP